MDNVVHPLSAVCHYTALPNLSNILTDDGVQLWATRYGFFSDKREFVWAKEKIFPKLEEIAQQNEEVFDPEHRVHPYILSFSELEDDMNMWRLYANDGKGVCLIFDREEIENLQDPNICSMSVVYANERNLEQQIELACRVFRQSYVYDRMVDNYHEVSAFIKHEDYDQEYEFRLAMFIYDGFTASYDPAVPDKCRITDFEELPDGPILFRAREDMLVPYVNILLPKTALKGIYIGYNCDDNNADKAIELLLQQRGYDIKPTKSSINNFNKIK